MYRREKTAEEKEADRLRWQEEQRKEQEEKVKGHELFRAMYQQIADNLKGWDLGTDKGERWDSYYLHNSDGAKVRISYASNDWRQDVYRPDEVRLKFSISAWDAEHQINYYQYVPRSVERPSCTCAASRGASAIAGDVRRKVLPGAVAYIAKGIAAYDKARAKEDRQWTLLQDLAEAAGSTVQRGYHGSDDAQNASIVVKESGRWEVTFKLYYQDEIKVSMERVTVEQAFRIAQWVKEEQER